MGASLFSSRPCSDKPHPPNPPPLHRQHFKSSPRYRDPIPRLGQAPECPEDVSPERGIVRANERQPQPPVDLVDLLAPPARRRVVGPRDAGARGTVVLVLDRADDLLEQVLHRDEARGAA